MTAKLSILNLKNKAADLEILHGVNLEVKQGEVHCIMGPNGSGKSTLVNTVMGHPAYEVTDGDILFDDESLIELESYERARKGLFLAFQYPKEIAGVTMLNFLTAAYNAHLSVKDPEARQLKAFRFRKLVLPEMEKLKIKPEFLDRFLNQGFSGGEKKKAEILQMRLLQPKIALLDETDSGLDVDALRIVSDGVNELKKETGMGVLIVTHYNRILEYVQPDFVHVMKKGKIVKSGGRDFAHELEQTGYENI
jgi:Fe-S cluster assembly ATP-binding protein